MATPNIEGRVERSILGSWRFVMRTGEKDRLDANNLILDVQPQMAFAGHALKL